MTLIWPVEMARPPVVDEPRWQQRTSNICLDFHGDPLRAELIVFSDGNHHMALEEAIRDFLKKHPAMNDIFYATTPPGILMEVIEKGSFCLGNLRLTIKPHVFIGPPQIMGVLAGKNLVSEVEEFMLSRGNVLLVRKGNPKKILGIADLLREDVRLFMSNPATETASYQLYRDSLMELARTARLEKRLEEALFKQPDRVMYGERIHHREAPEALANGNADVAMVYYHLALRYSRIFPDFFDFLDLHSKPLPTSGQRAKDVSRYQIGLVRGGGERGRALLQFMQSASVTKIYQKHGLARPSRKDH